MSRDFNGSTGYLSLAAINAAHLRISLPITVAAWVYPDTLKVAGIFTNDKDTSTHQGMWLDMSDTSGHLEAAYGDTTGSASGARRSKVTSGANALSSGVWQHVACRLRGATDMDILVNGTDKGGSYSGSGGTIAYDAGAASPVLIGQIAGTSFFDGKIAEVGFWRVSLSDAEITALAKGASPLLVRHGDLRGYWPIYGAATEEKDMTAHVVGMSLNGTAPAANHAPVGPPVRGAT